MKRNPILDELRAVRERLLEDAGGTLDGLVDRLQAEEEHSNRPHFHARPPGKCDRAAKPGNSAAA